MDSTTSHANDGQLKCVESRGKITRKHWTTQTNLASNSDTKWVKLRLHYTVITGMSSKGDMFDVWLNISLGCWTFNGKSLVNSHHYDSISGMNRKYVQFLVNNNMNFPRINSLFSIIWNTVMQFVLMLSKHGISINGVGTGYGNRVMEIVPGVSFAYRTA